MNIEKQIPLLEEILSEWKSLIGLEYQGYRNHVYRMIHFCFILKDCNEEDRKKIIIAGAFHDLGIWIEDTVDYIPPSIPPAIEYLHRKNLEAWSEEITLMIRDHHKVSKYKGEESSLVEIFRRADLVDFSLGLFNFGIEKANIEKLKMTFPNNGFHKNLAKRIGKWVIKHPLNPLPMFKW
ncbi:MAG: HD domain-containing protein [Limnoraphis robusta]|uniref:HD domain-containing protein n=1 Tax=Limnoraphis robusta CS-951 TaxID=1637645 RepID=A0A0F5Y8D6_9CYAN|nr:HD domain-containing protein [Limnoraphis robusta]KKD35191.1 hypothetical protein WN50_26650 [Limnoraphis robusta CS-951]